MKNSCFFLAITALFLFIFTDTRGQGTQIYGLKYMSAPWQHSFVSYDYSTQNFDTIFDFQGELTPTNFWSAIDPYNGRYFFGGGIDTLPGYRIFTVNIFDQTIQVSPQFISFIGEIEYDIYQNKLLINDHNVMRSYDLATLTIDTLGVLPEATAAISGTVRAYNNNSQQFMYINYTGTYSYILYDILSSSVISNVMFQTENPNHVVFDSYTDKYYGMKNDTIVEFNPLNGNTVDIAIIPGYWGMLNKEQAVFDSFNGLYIVPYYSNTSQSMIAVVDVNSGTLVSNNIFPANDFNKLYSRPRPVIKLINTELVTVFGTSYQWYFNSVLITGATSQKFSPSQSGFYSSEVTFLDGRPSLSEEYYYNLNPADSNSLVLQIYPNPAKETFQIYYPNILDTNPAYFSITDITGRTMETIDVREKVFPIEINCSILSSGMYIATLYNESGIISGSKFIISR